MLILGQVLLISLIFPIWLDHHHHHCHARSIYLPPLFACIGDLHYLLALHSHGATFPIHGGYNPWFPSSSFVQVKYQETSSQASKLRYLTTLLSFFEETTSTHFL